MSVLASEMSVVLVTSNDPSVKGDDDELPPLID